MHVHKVTRESAQRHSLSVHKQFCPTTLAYRPQTVLPNDTRSPPTDSSAQRHSLTIQRQFCPTTLAHHPETALPNDTRSPSRDSSAHRHSLTVHRQFCPTTLAHRPQTVLPNDTRSPSTDSSTQRHSLTIQRQCYSIHHRIPSGTFFAPCGKFGSPYLGRAQQPQEQRYPFLSVCAVFSCVQTTVWPPVFGICDMHTYVYACDCRGGLYGHRKSVCTGVFQGGRRPLTHSRDVKINQRFHCLTACQPNLPTVTVVFVGVVVVFLTAVSEDRKVEQPSPGRQKMRDVGEVFRFVTRRPAELDHSHHTNWCCFQGFIPSCPSPLTFSGGKLPTFVLTRKSETAREREREGRRQRQ